MRSEPTWVRALVALYPPEFRRAVGRDLARLLADQARDAARRSGLALAGFVARSAVVCVRDALLEWARAGRETWTEWTGQTTGGGSMLHSLKVTVRALARRPGYTVPVLITLVLGIGANTAMFTVLNGVVLRPLPYPQPDRLVTVYPVNVERGRDRAAFSLPDVRDWAERTTALEALGAYTMINSDLVYTGGDDALEIETAYVTADFWPALAVPPLHGRVPYPEEELGDNRVLVVSHGFWTRHLGADPEAVGRSLPVSGEQYRVVGVMPAGFAFPTPDVEVWAFLSVIPASSTPYHIREVRLLQAVGRLADGVAHDRALDDLNGVALGLTEDYPEENEGLTGAEIVPLREEMVGTVDGALVLLMAAALLILGVACANLANLALAREAGRATELALRSALGAGRGRRAALVLGENLVLALVGGGLGLALAVWGTEALIAGGGSSLPRAHEIRPDWVVATFALLVSIGTGAAFSLLPGLRAGDSEIATRLRAGGRGAATGSMRGALVVSQVSLSVVLLVGAWLLVRSLGELGRVDPGFDADRLVVAEMTFASNRFPERPEYLARFDATFEALERIPGVLSVASVRRFPFRGTGEGLRWNLPGAEDGEGTPGRLLQVSQGFFQTMGIPFLEGGDFPADAGEGRILAVLGRSLARAAFEGAPAVGRVLVAGGYELEVVGVVEDIRNADLREDPLGMVYVPLRQNPRRGAAFVMRTESDPGALLPSVRAAVRAADAAQPITDLTTARDIVDEQLAEPGFYSRLLAVFAVLALSLCSVGVYGVVAFGVSRRRREVGIRLAMGADAGAVRALVVRGGMAPVVVGIALGVALSLAGGQALEALLFGVSRYDAGAYAGSVAALAAIGLVGCYVPALRASRTRPAEVLADE